MFSFPNSCKEVAFIIVNPLPPPPPNAVIYLTHTSGFAFELDGNNNRVR